jgi:hypothetical protein
MNKVILLLLLNITCAIVYCQDGGKQHWSNYKTELILNEDGTYNYDLGFKYWKQKGNHFLKSIYDSIYTGKYERKFNKIILTADVPYIVSVTTNDTLSGTIFFIDNSSFNNETCHYLLKIIKDKKVEFVETDDSGEYYSKEKFDSIYISLFYRTCKCGPYTSFFDNKGNVQNQRTHYWYPIIINDSSSNKKISIKFYKDIEGKIKTEYKTIFKIKYFPKRLYLSDFDVLYDEKSIKKEIFFDHNGNPYYKYHGIGLNF